MKTGKLLMCFVLMVMVFGSIGLVFAEKITGSIKSGKMIIRADQGDKIERYLFVENTNDVVINIELSATGDLEDYVDFKDDKFTLQPGEGKKAYFTVEAKKAGTTETTINVKFIPADGGNGVGLRSSVFIIAEDKGLIDRIIGGDDSDDDSDDDSSDGDVSFGVGGSNGDSNESSNGLMIFVSISTLILAVIFIVLVVYASKMRKEMKKRGKNKPKKSVKKDELVFG